MSKRKWIEIQTSYYQSSGYHFDEGKPTHYSYSIFKQPQTNNCLAYINKQTSTVFAVRLFRNTRCCVASIQDLEQIYNGLGKSTYSFYHQYLGLDRLKSNCQALNLIDYNLNAFTLVGVVAWLELLERLNAQREQYWNLPDYHLFVHWILNDLVPQMQNRFANDQMPID